MTALHLDVFVRLALGLVIILEFFQYCTGFVIRTLLGLDDFQVAVQVVFDQRAVVIDRESYHGRHVLNEREKKKTKFSQQF